MPSVIGCFDVHQPWLSALGPGDPGNDDIRGVTARARTGASTGIGLESAKQFAGDGFDLLITAPGSRLDTATNTLSLDPQTGWGWSGV
jgi:hypothetical protein